MEYFILLPNTKKSDLTEANLLGTVGLNQIFWPSQGLDVLYNIANNKPELLSEVTIINNKYSKFTVEEFMNLLDTLKIKKR